MEPYLVYYVLFGNTRIRTFRSKESMDRWMRKFHRENAEQPNSDESWIEMIVTGVNTVQILRSDVTLVRHGG